MQVAQVVGESHSALVNHTWTLGFPLCIGTAERKSNVRWPSGPFWAKGKGLRRRVTLEGRSVFKSESKCNPVQKSSARLVFLHRELYFSWFFPGDESSDYVGKQLTAKHCLNRRTLFSFLSPSQSSILLLFHLVIFRFFIKLAHQPECIQLINLPPFCERHAFYA